MVYVGCTNDPGDLCWFGCDPESGALTPMGQVATGHSTSFGVLDPQRQRLFITHNRADRLAGFTLDALTGTPHPINQIPVRGRPGEPSAGPSYVHLDPTGRFLLSANYRGHNVQVHAVGPQGELGATLSDHSAGTHAHCIRLDPSGRFAFTPYLGADLVAQYRFDPETGALSPNQPGAVPVPSGEGPRHLTFHPNGRVAYAVNELGGSVATFSFDPGAGTLALRGLTPALPPDYQGRRWAAEIAVHPKGRLLFVSNRSHDSLARFAVDPTSGDLTPAGFTSVRVGSGDGPRTPRGFALDPVGRYIFVANQDSAELLTFSVDSASGRLDFVTRTPTPAAPTYIAIWDPPLTPTA